MADEVGLKIEGLDKITRALRDVPKKLRKRALRNALAAGARIVRDAAKQAAPVLKSPTQYRLPGTVQKAIKVRTSRRDTRSGDVGVFVNVKPLTRGQIGKFKADSGRKGAQNPNDPFYWRFLNFGTAKMQPYRFLEAGAAKLPDALAEFEAKLGQQVRKLNVNPDDPL